MINAIEKAKLEKLFASLDMDISSPATITGWYALLTQIGKEVQPKGENSIIYYFASAPFASFFHTFRFDTIFTIKELFAKTAQIYELFNLVSSSGLLLDHISFFDIFCPNMVADWYTFEKVFSHNRVHMFLCLFAIVEASGDSLGSPESIKMHDANDEFKSHKELYQSLSMDAFSFYDAWTSVYFHDLISSQPQKISPTHRKAIQSAIKAYRAYKKHSRLKPDFPV